MTLAESESGRTHYRWLIVTLVVVGGVYLWYAMNQYNRLNDLNQRQLSNASAELKSSLETAIETVTQFNKKWLDAQKRGRLDNPTAEENTFDETGNEAKRQSDLCNFAKNQEFVDLVGCENLQWSDLRFVHAVTLPTLGIEARSKEDPKASPESIVFRFRTNRVLQELAFPDTFGLIFVATKDGDILYQEAPTRRLWLRQLRWGEQMFRDGNADRPATFQIQNLKEMLGGDATWNKLRALSSRTSLELGGVSHQIYLQPLQLESGERVELVIGGAVPTNLIVRDALAMDTHLVGALAFLFLLGLLGFPFVKLAWLDPHERFGLWDINRLYLSTGALLVLLTCATMALDGYYRWHAVADEGLESLAKRVESHFLDEVGSIRDQLADYDAQVSLQPVSHWLRKPVLTEWFKQSNTELVAPQRPVFLRQVSWIGPEGRQIWKSTSDTLQGRISVEKRVYYRAVRDNNLFRLRADNKPPFFIGPDRSIADGKFYTFISMRSALKVPNSDRTLVAAASAQLLSLDRQPLPAGYGFAVVNREGRVLYHSDRRLSLRENLFEELSEGDQAQAMIYAGRAGDLKSGYRERSHEFYFQPMALMLADEPVAAGFYVVAFRDISVERTLVGHAFVSGLAGPLLFLLSIYAAALAGIAAVARYTGGRWSAWLWPHGGLNHIYKRQAITFLLLLVLSVVIYVRRDSMGGFLLLPVVAPIAGMIIYARGVGTDNTRRRLTSPVWQTSALLLVLVAMVMVPSAAMFRLVLSQEFAKLILTERAWVAAQQADVVRAAEVEAVTDYYRPLSGGEARAAARRAYFNCVPAPFDAVQESGAKRPRRPRADVEHATQEAGTEPPPIAPGFSASGTPLRCAPSSGAGSAEFAGAGAAASIDARLTPIDMDATAVRALHWIDDVLPIENMRVVRQHAQDRAFAYSPDGTLLKSLRISSVALIGLGLTLALLVWWIRWNTNRLFLADVDGEAATPPAAPIAEVWEKLTTDEQMLLLQVSREGIANPYQRPMTCHLLDAGLLRLSPDLRPFSPQFDRFLRDKEQELSGQLGKWQQVNRRHSWRHGRLILIAAVAALGILIVATQPALQSSLLGIASGITGALTAALKLRDAVGSWFDRKGVVPALRAGE